MVFLSVGGGAHIKEFPFDWINTINPDLFREGGKKKKNLQKRNYKRQRAMWELRTRMHVLSCSTGNAFHRQVTCQTPTLKG